MKETQISPVHAANLTAHSGNTAYGLREWDLAIEFKYMHDSQ